MTRALLVLALGCIGCGDAPPPAPKIDLEFRQILLPGEAGYETAATIELDGQTYRAAPPRVFPLESASLSQDPVGYPAIGFEIRADERAAFEAWTASLVGKQIAIAAGGVVLMAPTLNTPLTGEGIIEGRFVDGSQLGRLIEGLRAGAKARR